MKIKELETQRELEHLASGDVVRLDFETADLDTSDIFCYEGIIDDKYSFINQEFSSHQIQSLRFMKSGLEVKAGVIYYELPCDEEIYTPDSKNYERAKQLLINSDLWEAQQNDSI